MTTPVPSLIGGRLVEPRSDVAEDIPNPSTGDPIALLRHSTPDEVDEAIREAARASQGWAATPVGDRSDVLFRFRSALVDRLEEIARLIVEENGKTLEEARGEVRRGIEAVEFACGAPTLLMGGTISEVARGIDEELVRFPVGVVAGITPFNFPVMIPLWMIAPALACGNAFVLKPSQRTPSVALRLAEMLSACGLPDGVLNIVHGAGDVVDRLITHPNVDAVSFVGSGPVARHIYTVAAGAGKRAQALGGAKNHIVVMDDADLETSVPAIVSSAFGMAGQRCLAGSVAVAVGSIGDVLAKELAAAASGLHVGPGEQPGVDMGPVIRDERRKELLRYIDDGVAGGASLVSDGRDLAGQKGFFLGPTVFDNVTPDMPLWREELFGPILSVVRATEIDEAIASISRSTYGNMAAIFTSSGRNAREFGRRAEAGMIGVNVGVPAPAAFFPFTGWKGSFFGDLHATGADSIRFYTKHKVITSRWP